MATIDTCCHHFFSQKSGRFHHPVVLLLLLLLLLLFWPTVLAEKQSPTVSLTWLHIVQGYQMAGFLLFSLSFFLSPRLFCFPPPEQRPQTEIHSDQIGGQTSGIPFQLSFHFHFCSVDRFWRLSNSKHPKLPKFVSSCKKIAFKATGHAPK